MRKQSRVLWRFYYVLRSRGSNLWLNGADQAGVRPRLCPYHLAGYRPKWRLKELVRDSSWPTGNYEGVVACQQDRIHLEALSEQYYDIHAHHDGMNQWLMNQRPILIVSNNSHCIKKQKKYNWSSLENVRFLSHIRSTGYYDRLQLPPLVP